MSMVYQWKPRVSIVIDAQLAGETLEKLRVRNNGQLTPGAVVTAAAGKRSPLHPVFEWNDGTAASLYREDQARYLLRSITVVMDDGPDQRKPIRAFVSVVCDGESSYTSISHAMSDAGLRQKILQRALAELNQWRGRYEEYQELAEIFAAIDVAEGRVAA